MTVYVIGEGEYSSYHVVGVITDQALSEHLDKHGYQIDTFELDVLRRDSFEWRASVWLSDGSLQHTPSLFTVEDGAWLREHPLSKEDPDSASDHAGDTDVYGWGPTPEAAVKSARDRRAQTLAERAEQT